MRNKILTLFRNNIPYIKELRILSGSVTASILMQQLDYWFEKSPKGFYKFLEPCENNKFYKKGDSWTEELGFSKAEFKTAFEKIGTTYKSKKEFTKALNEKNLFKGKFYCCYIDRIKNITVYYRNHDLLDLELEKLLNSVSEESSSTVNQDCLFTEINNLDLQENEVKAKETKEESTIPVSEESSYPYVKKVTFDITENTTEKEITDREKKENIKIETVEKVKDKLKEIFGQSVENPLILDSKINKIITLITSLGLEKVLETLDKIKSNDFLMELKTKKGDINFLNYILGLEKFTDIYFGAHDPHKIKIEEKVNVIAPEDLKKQFEEDDYWST